MQGYDAERALAYICKTINRKPFADLGPTVDSYLQQAQALDMRFMVDSGVLTPDGFAGEAEYDEDEALDFIVDEITRTRGLGDEDAVLVAVVVDAYMRAQEAFLLREGLAES